MYSYDAFGRRIEKNVNNTITRYIYDGWDIVQEHDATGALLGRVAHGSQIDQPLVLERGGAGYFYHPDHLGSVRKMTDDAGTVVNSYDYDSFGRFETRSENVAQPYAFTGREFDPETGLSYFRLRYYDPEVGRFISEDPIGFAGGDSILYRYAFGNPVNLVDPYGLIAFIETGITDCFASAAGTATGGFFGAIAQTLITGFRNALLSSTSLSTGALLTAAAAAGAASGAGEALSAAGCGRAKSPPVKRPKGGNPKKCWGDKVGEAFPKRPLPTTTGFPKGPPLSDKDVSGAYTQLGWRINSQGNPLYPQAREFDGAGQAVKDIDFTDHGTPEHHTEPHEHRRIRGVPNKKSRDEPKPFKCP